MRCAVAEQVEERQHATARAPAAFLDDAEIDPPARRRGLHPAGVRECGMDVADDGRAILARPAAVHRDDIDHHDVARLVREQFAAVRDHVERPLGKMHLIAAARLGRELADLRNQHGTGQRLRQYAPLIGIQAPLRGHHMDNGHRGSPWAYAGDYDMWHSAIDLAMSSVIFYNGTTQGELRCRPIPAQKWWQVPLT